MALEEEKSITLLYKVVILYFQCDLGKILEEIYCNEFQSFYCNVSIGKSASGGIYKAWVLPTDISAGIFAGIFTNVFASTSACISASASIDASTTAFVGVSIRSSAGVSAESFARDEYSCNWGMRDSISASTIAKGGRSCN